MNYHIFTHPYVLIEDRSGKCKPFHREYTGENKEKVVPTLLLKKYTIKTPKRKKDLKKPGLCELCLTYFTDYKQHIKEEEHTTNTDDWSDYKEIDQFISRVNRKKRKSDGNGDDENQEKEKERERKRERDRALTVRRKRRCEEMQGWRNT